MAKEADVDASTISRIWRSHGLQPHRIETFKLSTDPEFVEKLRDVVGLYVEPVEARELGPTRDAWSMVPSHCSCRST